MKSLLPSSRIRYSAILILIIVCTVALIKSATSSAQEGRSNAERAKAQEAGPVQGSEGLQKQRTDVLERLVSSEPATKTPGDPGTILSSQIDANVNFFVPTITATKVDTLFTDVDGDGRADPGDTLLYTVTINNAGTDAANVVFADTIDVNTTLVGGSTNTTPIAFDDPGYAAAGNVRITVSAGSGVLTNDIDPDTGNNTGLTASAGASSANGGNVAMSANGGFSYNPAPGFTGTDTFTYTVTDAAGATGTGTVTFNVSGMIWFINAAAGGGGDGRLTTPFNCYTGIGCYSAVAADDPGDNIFLYSGAYTGGNTLLANQRLIGQGAGASLSTITGITPPTGSDALPSTGGARPTITTVIAAVNAINLGTGNTLRGFNVGNTTAADIAGTSFGTLTASEMELNGTGSPLILTTGTLAATFDNLAATSAPGGPGIGLTTVGGTLTVSGTTSISGAGTQGISISGSSVAANFGTSTTLGSTTQGILVSTSTGNVSFGNTIVTAASDGVSLQNNSAGTRSFGTLSTTNGSGVGFLHGVGGGLVTVSGLATFTNPGGRCISIEDSTTLISFADVIATQCGSTGVFLDDNTGAITFADLDISPDANQRGFHATDQSTGVITTTSGTIPSTGTATAVEIVGTSAATRTPINMQWTSISKNGGSNSGIILTNTSGTGFTINGTGVTVGSGGTLENIVGADAIALNTIGGLVTLKNMIIEDITAAGDATDANGTRSNVDAISGVTIDAGLTLDNTTIRRISDNAILGGTNGVPDVATVWTGLTINNCTIEDTNRFNVLHHGDATSEGTVRILGIRGTVNVTNSLFQRGAEFLDFTVTAGTLTMTVTNSDFLSAYKEFVAGDNSPQASVGLHGIDVTVQGTSNAAVTIGDRNNAALACDFLNNRLASVRVANDVGATGNVDVTMGRNTFRSNDHSSGIKCTPGCSAADFDFPMAGVLVMSRGADTATFDAIIDRNTFDEATNASGGVGQLTLDMSRGVWQVLAINNTFDTPGNAPWFMRAELNAITAKVKFQNNIGVGGFFTCPDASCGGGYNAPGLRALADVQNGGKLDLTIDNDTFAEHDAGFDPGQTFEGRALNVGAANSICMDLRNNNAPDGYGLEQFNASQTVNLFTAGGSGTCSAPGSPGNCQNALNANANQGGSNNPNLVPPFVQVFGTVNVVSAACQTPSLSFAGNEIKQREFLVRHENSGGAIDLFRNQWDDLIPQPSLQALNDSPVGARTIATDPASENHSEETSVQSTTLTTSVLDLAHFAQPTRTEQFLNHYSALRNLQSVQEVRRSVSGGNAQGDDHTLQEGKPQDDSVKPSTNETAPTKDDKEEVVQSGETITINGGSPAGFTLPAGKAITITFRVTANSGVLPAYTQVSNQGAVSGSNFLAVILTDDPSVGGAADPTVTPIDHTTVAVSSDANPSAFGQNVTFTATMTGVPSRVSDPPGTVQFKADGNNIGAAVPVVVGAVNDNVSTAQASISSLTVATHVITAEYSGGGAGATGYNANIGTLAGGQIVGKANTTTAVTSSQNPSVFGQSVTFTATIAPVAPGAGTVTGTVSFLDGVNPIAGCQNVALSSSQAQCVLSGLVVGNHTISAAYAGDSNFNTSNGAMTGNPQVVNKADTSVGLTSATNPSVFGQSVTFTATIGVTAPGGGTPTGTVQFLDGVNPIAGCTSVVIAAGQAQCMASGLVVGNHTISAAYSGDGNFNTSNGSMTGNPQVVNKASTTVDLTSATNPSVFGQSVTFTATIGVTAPGSGTPTGTVQFLDGVNPIAGCTSVAVAAGQAQCVTSALVVGNHTITAAYSGDGNFNTSNGSMTGNPQVVNKADTTVGLTSATNPSVFGQSVTFTATLAVAPPGAGTPTGTINFLDGVNPVTGCQNVAIAAGQAQCITSALAVGNHTMSAAYSGDGNFNTSTGNMTGNPQVVNKADTSVGLVSDINPSVFGQPVTFTATVAVTAPGAGSPSGTVNFLDGGNPIVGCQNVLLQALQAQCQPGSLSVGNHTITADYSGDGSFNTSTGSMTGNPQVVNKADTSMGLTSSQNPAPLGTNLTFTATISVTAPGAGTPSGTVQFLDGLNPIAGCTAVAVAAGQAQCMTTALTVGNHTITAAYSGDASFNTSNGSLTGNPQVITGPPLITPTVGLTRVQGETATNSQIAVVSDDVATPGSIVVTAETVPAGMTIGAIINTNGTITADIGALCAAVTGDNVIVIKATDGKTLSQTANLTVNVTANPAPTLGNYTNSTIVVGCKLFSTPDAPPADNVSVSSVMATGSGGFTGVISVDPATGIVTITDNGPVGGPHTITVTVTDSCGTTFQRMFTVTVVNPPTAPTEFDFDGDRKADISVYRTGATVNDPSFWYILRSSDNVFQAIQFGADSDVIVPGDWDGNGTTEVGIYRPSTNTWFTSLDPGTNYGAFQWGVAGDIPVPGQYDADTKTDIAVFRPADGNWYIAKSTGGSEIRHWGQSGDKPIPADVDGDGKTDLVQYRESEFNFYIQKSLGGTVVQSWGTTGDKLVLADYDGDGKDDIAVFRPSNAFWYILQSTGGTRTEQWGLTGVGDIPVPADYDNDGKADLMVYRSSAGTWHIFKSCLCTPLTTPFGISTDKPIPTAFTP